MSNLSKQAAKPLTDNPTSIHIEPPKPKRLGPNPSGFCMCGCGGDAPLAQSNCAKYGIIKGQPQRYIFGHQHRSRCIPKYVDGIPAGLCGCGCGGKTTISKYTDSKSGTKMGFPFRYIRGHNLRLSPLLYVEEDRGYKTPCWIWQRSKGKTGHGHTWDSVQKRSRPAHCIEYEKHKGPIPLGKVLHHMCEVKPCINPDHLMVTTSRINSQLAIKSRLTEERVLRMRWLHTRGVRYAELAKIFDISWQTARTICLRKTWKDIKDVEYPSNLMYVI